MKIKDIFKLLDSDLYENFYICSQTRKFYLYDDREHEYYEGNDIECYGTYKNYGKMTIDKLITEFGNEEIIKITTSPHSDVIYLVIK